MNCTPKQLYDLLLDVPRWPEWDPDLASVDLTDKPDPDSLTGASGTLHMKFNKSFPFRITPVDPPRYFSYITPLPGTELEWYWEIKEEEGGAVMVEGLAGSGFVSRIYKLALGGRCAEAFEQALENVKKICESQE